MTEDKNTAKKTKFSASDEDLLRGLETHSNEVQEIMSFIPGWIIRWGITTIFAAVLMLVIGSVFIKYPDSIVSRITIVSSDPPADLIARTSGNIQLFVEDNALVKKGDLLAFIDNTAEINDVLHVKMELNRFSSVIQNSDSIITFIAPTQVVLGPLQADYSAFNQHLIDYKVFYRNNYYPKKIEASKSKKAYLLSLNSKYRNQLNFSRKEKDIAEKQYSSDKSLFEKGVISDLEFMRSESAYLQKKFSFETSEINVLQNSLQIDELESQINQLEQEFYESQKTVLENLNKSHKQMLSAISNWEQLYVLRSPMEGTVSYLQFWSDGQFVNSGSILLTVVPESEKIVGKLFLPTAGAGKVEVGQTVNVKLDSYPYREFGIVRGTIENISLVPKDNMYYIDISFPDELISSYGNTLDFRQQMQGTAEIITKDLSLFERIFNQLRSIIKNI